MVYVKIIQGAVDMIDTCKSVPTNFLLPLDFLYKQYRPPVFILPV